MRLRELYEGEMISYVKCSECGYESRNTDRYMDLSLPIKNDHDKMPATNTSLEMALENFLRPEKLEGDN